MSSSPQNPAAPRSQGNGIPRVLVATTALLSFISFWRAAAIVLNDLASSAYYAGGEAEGYIGKAAPWFILGIMLFSYAVRAIYFDPRSISWLVLSIGVIAWGVLAIGRPSHRWARWQKCNRGGSMIVLGLLMLSIGRVPFRLVGKFLAVCGLVLILRGALGALLILRQR